MLILPNEDITLTKSKQISLLTKPLKKQGITFVNYFKITKTGIITDLNNAPEMTEYFYYKSELYKKFIPIINNILNNKSFVLPDSISNQYYFDLMRNKFDIDNIIFFAIKTAEYAVFWHFGSCAGNNSIKNFYINNIDLLKCFIDNFLIAAKDLIEDCENNSYYLSLNDYEIDNIFNPVDNKYLLSTNSTSIAHSFNTPIKILPPTLRELECLKLCATGKTAEEISIILKISKRTAQAHIQNLKAKLKCNKTTHLIAKAVQMGFL